MCVSLAATLEYVKSDYARLFEPRKTVKRLAEIYQRRDVTENVSHFAMIVRLDIRATRFVDLIIIVLKVFHCETIS